MTTTSKKMTMAELKELMVKKASVVREQIKNEVKEPVKNLVAQMAIEKIKIKRTKGNITLTDEQHEAVTRIIDWFKHTDKHTFELAGYAGTGKSTVVDFVLSNLNINRRYTHMCAPTGTASLVLKSKTPGFTSTTLHRAIYTLDNTNTGFPKFVPNYDGLSDIELLIVDEASMIGVKMGKDLLSVTRAAGVRVLIIGDPEQLPPVSDNGCRAFLDNPDFTLTRIMRQAEDNKIIETSMLIRNNKWFQPDANLKYGDELMVLSRSKIDTSKLYNAFARCISNGGAVIVGKNNTRRALTAQIRNILGFHSNELMDGDKIVIKHNIDLKKSGYFYSGDIDMLTNGMVGIVSDLEDCGYYYTFTFTSDKFDIEVRELKLRKDILNEEVDYMGKGNKSLSTILDNAKRETGQEQEVGINATYGYILTCHNAQGSQWDTVYVIDESSSFKEDASRWLYTAVTRAAKRLVIVKSFNK